MMVPYYSMKALCVLHLSVTVVDFKSCHCAPTYTDITSFEAAFHILGKQSFISNISVACIFFLAESLRYQKKSSISQRPESTFCRVYFFRSCIQVKSSKPMNYPHNL